MGVGLGARAVRGLRPGDRAPKQFVEAFQGRAKLVEAGLDGSLASQQILDRHRSLR